MITKKRIIITSLIVVIAGALLWVKYYFIDQSVVDITITGSVKSVGVYRESDSAKVTTLTASEKLRLPHGKYYVSPLDNNYSTNHISFTSPNSSIVVIDPDYSTDKLSTLAVEAKPFIEALFQQKYPSLMSDYSINSFTLYKKGEWGGGLLVRNDSTQNDTKDVYRFIVRYNTSDWSIENYPDLILTQSTYKDTPADVLYAVDTLDYNPPN